MSDREFAVEPEEIVEVKAFLDLFGNIPGDFAARNGLAFTAIGQGCAVSFPAAPAIGLNRILGVRGIESLECALEWMRTKSGERYLQMSPIHMNDIVRARLAAEPCTEKGAGWLKLKRHAPSYPLPKPEDMTIRTATPDDAHLFGSIMCEGFGFPDLLSSFWSTIVGRDKWTCLIAEIDGQPAGTAAMFIENQYAWLGGGTTVQHFRNRGVQKRLIEARIYAGAVRGVLEFAVEVAKPEPGKMNPSFENLTKAGFHQVYERKNYLLAS